MSHNIIDEQVEKEAAAPTVAGDANPESDLVWGGEGVGRVIGRTKQQVYHLLEIGALDGAAAKIGHKTIVGSRRALSRLPFRKIK
jgi:Protein of unknown function (DUF3853)